jgi:hypothetical protein
MRVKADKEAMTAVTNGLKGAELFSLAWRWRGKLRDI